VKFSEVIREILSKNTEGLSPQEIRDIVKLEYPEFYGTESHHSNVKKGNYQNLDHALLAQIYTASRSLNDVFSDKTVKPMKLSLLTTETDLSVNDDISLENLSKLESGEGVLYVLGTNVCTKEGDEIIKIGITSGNVETRISQLYTTGVPYRFRIIKEHSTKNYAELEHSLHKLLDLYRINKSREFFTEKALHYIDRIIEIHNEILEEA
jgi:hypothetical protein